MPVIDADTHVDETEATWEYVSQHTPRYAPATMEPPADEKIRSGLSASRSRFWLVEGRIQVRAIRDDIHHPPRPRRELDDLEGRIADMDKMGVDIQVLFPTFFIRYISLNPQPESELAKSYNRWIAEKCARTNGRMRWAAVLPWMDTNAAVEELKWAKANGACGIFKRGYDLNIPVSDPHFFPIYEAANELDLPLCIHTGHPGSDWDRGFPIIGSFLSVLSAKLPEKFPNLRFGFIEAGASWIPYAISQLAMRERSERHHEEDLTTELSKDLFSNNRLFVTVDPVDDIEHLLQFDTAKNLMIGTDYSHSDASANLSALGEVKRWEAAGKIDASTAVAILENNPQKFYGL